MRQQRVWRCAATETTLRLIRWLLCAADRCMMYTALQACRRQQGVQPCAAATTSAPSAPPRYSTGQPGGGAKHGGKTVVITGGSQVRVF